MFSTHSVRKAGAKKLGDSGAPRALLAKRGCWTDGSMTLSEVHDVDQTAVVGAFGALHLGHAEGAAKELSDLRQMVKVREIRSALASKLRGSAVRAQEEDARVV